MPIWRKRAFPADTLALPNSQPFMDIDDGRALETQFFSEFGWLQQRGDSPPSNSNHSGYGTGGAVEILKLEYA
jgi:hypothetical protein